MPLSLQFVGDLAESWLAVAIVTLVTVGPWLIYKLHPEWRERKRQASIDVFDRLCEAYKEYRENPNDEIARAKIGFCAEEYCNTNVNHRLVDMAFKSENTTFILETLRKLPNEVCYENSMFKKALYPSGFPREKTVKIGTWITLLLYLTFCTMFGGVYLLFSLDLIGMELTIKSMMLSSLPFLVTLISGTNTRRNRRLVRIGDLIEEHMPDGIDRRN